MAMVHVFLVLVGLTQIVFQDLLYSHLVDTLEYLWIPLDTCGYPWILQWSSIVSTSLYLHVPLVPIKTGSEKRGNFAQILNFGFKTLITLKL